MKIITHIQRWNKWRKSNLNHPVYQFFVLIGLFKSPTLPLVLLDDEKDALLEAFQKGLILDECPIREDDGTEN